MFQSIFESIVLLKFVHMQFRAVSDALLLDVLLFDVKNVFGIENGSFIGNWISINLFAFGPSVGWKNASYY